jgi:hypothetical protein
LLALTMRPTYCIAVVVLVAAFVALHSYLGPLEFCGPQACPHGVEAHASASVDPSATTVLAIGPVALVAFLRPTSDKPPAEAYRSPEPHPPQLFSVR